MFPWINTIFAYPSIRVAMLVIGRRLAELGFRRRRQHGLRRKKKGEKGGERRKSASYAIIVGCVCREARSSCDVTRRPYCAPSWTRSVIAIKKCGSHTWRRSRGFQPRHAKGGSRRGEAHDILLRRGRRPRPRPPVSNDNAARVCECFLLSYYFGDCYLIQKRHRSILSAYL